MTSESVFNVTITLRFKVTDKLNENDYLLLKMKLNRHRNY